MAGSSSTPIAALPSEGWERLSAGAGSKGPRWYDWRREELSDPAVEGFTRWLLIRRSIAKPSELTAYVTIGPADTSLAQ